MKFSIIFQNRDFTPALDQHDLRFVVNSYSFEAMGGPKEASITVYGGELGLEDTINWLRRPVTIYDRRGTAVWWGYVHQVQVRKNALEIAPSLDSMFNRVAVVYSYVEAGSQLVGQRRTTAWVDDLDSQAEYGVKEYLSSTDGASDASAEARRDAILKGQAWPYGGVSQFGSPRGAVRYSGAKKSTSATLICRGWWETLGWKYATVGLTSALSYLVNDSYLQVRTDAAGLRVMQSFTVGANAINALGVGLFAWKVGSPADNLAANLYLADPATGLPQGASLGSGTIAGTTLGTSGAWVTATLGAAVTLAAATQYVIVLYRSGATDTTNYYRTGIDSGAGYAGGLVKLSTDGGATWGATQTYDVAFTIGTDNNVDSTAQISDLVSHFGQFLTATDIEAASGVLLPSYQNGDKTALAVVLELLAAGGANDRRLLAWVNAQRRVEVAEEPAPGSAAHYMDSHGKMFGPGGMGVTEEEPPVGVWVRLKDVLSGVVDLTKVSDPSLQFVEGAGWSVDGGAAYRFKGKPSVESLLMVG